MEHKFWHDRWHTNQIGFHLENPNPLLVQNFSILNLKKGDRVFVPLCGKSVDIPWLISKGFKVVGAELSQIAIDQLFSNLGMKPQIQNVSELLKYSAEGIEIFVGDVFKISNQMLGKVDAVYDRAALVALPEKMRQDYSLHISKIAQNSPQLIITFEYDQSAMDGPPFSVVEKEVRELYQKTFEVKKIATEDVKGGLKGKCPAKEVVWLLL